MTSCHDVMRLMINVHPKRHHEHTRASTTTTTIKSTTKTTAQPATTQLVSTAAASTTTIETTTTKVASLKRTMSSTDKGTLYEIINKILIIRFLNFKMGLKNP